MAIPILTALEIGLSSLSGWKLQLQANFKFLVDVLRFGFSIKEDYLDITLLQKAGNHLQT